MTDDHLTKILDSLSQAVILIDGQRTVFLANTKARDLFGHDLEGRSFDLAIRHPSCLQAIDEVFTGAEHAEANITLPGSKSAVYQVRITGLPEASGQDARAAITISDLSQLHDVEQMRSDFVANVSHELRSPLTALGGFIETLRGAAKDDPKARGHFLNVMEREALRMNRLIDDLLTLSKFESNRRIQPTNKCDLRQIIDQIIATLAVQTEREGKEIVLKAPDAAYVVQGENDELTQVFQNLIENAIKYGDDKTSITITLTVADQVIGVGGPAVVVEVSDQGSGIAAIHLPRLTERFYRIDDSRSRENGGTGLGLAIVKHIVNRHRGKLQIASEIGVGSSFKVSLPAFKSGN